MAKAVVVSESRFPVVPRVGYSRPIYSQPSFYGTCTAITGAGIVSNNCLPGTTPVATSGNGCYCYDPATQWAGCGDTANGVCRLPMNPFIPTPIVVSQPVPENVSIWVPPHIPWPWRAPSRRPIQRWDHGLHPCPPGMLC